MPQVAQHDLLGLPKGQPMAPTALAQSSAPRPLNRVNRQPATGSAENGGGYLQ
jgi:hypothetical protein